MENGESRAVNFSSLRLSFFDALIFRLDSREVSVFRGARAEVAGVRMHDSDESNPDHLWKL